MTQHEGQVNSDHFHRAPMSLSNPPVPHPSGIALFLDFDGTLAELAASPDAVVVPADVIATLQALQEATDGAVAIVTGRDIDTIDRFIAPLRLPVAGVHGLVLRGPDGALQTASIPQDTLSDMARQLDAFASQRAGVIVERKTGSVALHYRQAPEAEVDCIAAMEALLANTTGFRMLAGKAVVEARANGHDKGTAIATFLGQTAFSNRRAVFAGDDVTDEDGFRVVNAHTVRDAAGGITIKVGPGETHARYRLDTVAQLHAWLAAVAALSGHSNPETL